MSVRYKIEPIIFDFEDRSNFLKAQNNFRNGLSRAKRWHPLSHNAESRGYDSDNRNQKDRFQHREYTGAECVLAGDT